ncbi:MAG: HAD family hydrolase [Magnetococcales bacterium]|nr:HAD family hydrolase [Magnetococcales bacterium]
MPTQLRLAILRNIMLEPLATYLRYEALSLDCQAQVTLGDYDTVLQEAVAGAPTVYDQQTHAILIVLYLEGLSWDLARNFASLSEQAVENEINRLLDLCHTIVQGIRSKTAAMILWHGFLPSPYPALGIFDSQSHAGQSRMLHRLNTAICDVVRAVPNSFFVDMGHCLARVGSRHFFDHRFWHMNRAPFTLEAYAEMAREVSKFVRASLGKNKKCLVLDCDNTLWGGIIGEDGMAGIKLGTTSPGSAYREFQQQILELYSRGVILALCSKNNEDDVWDVLQNHPGSLLKRQHFAAWRINWQDKVANIRELAVELNIGLDSMVFVDDSAFEVEMVRRELPVVTVLQQAKEQLFQARFNLLACGLFDTLTLSQEDRTRGSMYTAEAERKRLMQATTDLHSYFKSLAMQVEIAFTDQSTMARVAQLTQKTNQFNLTTRRYSEADISQFVAGSAADVLHVRLLDRFGDSGIIGVCILRYQQQEAYLDTFLLSCRALGRGVEEVLLRHALHLAKRQGVRRVVGEYYATAKNSQVQTFYGKQGFTLDLAPDSPATHRYFFPLEEQTIPADPDTFTAIISPLRG